MALPASKPQPATLGDIVDDWTVETLVVGEIARGGGRLDAVQLANRPSLKTVGMLRIRAAAEKMATRGILEYAGPGYGGSDTWSFAK